MSHVDKARILADGANDPRAGLLGESGRRLAAGPMGEGEAISLSVSSYSPKSSWTYVSVHSLDALTARIRSLMRASILAIVGIVLAGSCGVLFMATRLSLPFRKLIAALSQGYPGTTGPRVRFANEFQFLSFVGV